MLATSETSLNCSEIFIFRINMREHLKLTFHFDDENRDIKLFEQLSALFQAVTSFFWKHSLTRNRKVKNE